jgi:hypothetical protein
MSSLPSLPQAIVEPADSRLPFSLPIDQWLIATKDWVRSLLWHDKQKGEGFKEPPLYSFSL